MLTDKSASAVEIGLHEIPMLSPLALLQAVCARHGFVAIADKRKGEIAIDTLEGAWGKKDDVWPEIVAKCAQMKSESDLGKIAYLLASILAFASDAHTSHEVKRLREEINDIDGRVNVICMNILLAAERPTSLLPLSRTINLRTWILRP